MSLEADLVTLLKTLTANVYPDIGPENAAAPYVTFQAIGGEPLRYLDKTPGSKRQALMQINAWAKTRADALALIHQIEDALCASTAFQADPIGEALSTFDETVNLRGSLQTFSIWATR
jgi:hypothetical protein